MRFLEENPESKLAFCRQAEETPAIGQVPPARNHACDSGEPVSVTNCSGARSLEQKQERQGGSKGIFQTLTSTGCGQRASSAAKFDVSYTSLHWCMFRCLRLGGCHGRMTWKGDAGRLRLSGRRRFEYKAATCRDRRVC